MNIVISTAPAGSHTLHDDEPTIHSRTPTDHIDDLDKKLSRSALKAGLIRTAFANEIQLPGFSSSQYLQLV
jgi:hypothetical protein